MKEMWVSEINEMWMEKGKLLENDKKDKIAGQSWGEDADAKWMEPVVEN